MQEGLKSVTGIEMAENPIAHSEEASAVVVEKPINRSYSFDQNCEMVFNF